MHNKIHYKLTQKEKNLLTQENIDICRGDNTFTLLSDYKNNRYPLELRCNRCDNEFTTTLRKIEEGTRDLCPECDRTYRALDYKRKLVTKFPNIVLPYIEDEFEDVSSYITVRCLEHGDVQVNPSNLLQHQLHHCPKCGNKEASKKVSEKKMIPYKTFIKRLKEKTTLIPTKITQSQYKGYVKDNVQLKCTKCNKTKPYRPERAIYNNCTYCNLEAYTSNGEKTLANFIKTYYKGEVQTNVRNILESGRPGQKMELDIYLPELNIAIEYNGLYWHSIKNVNKSHHSFKTYVCKQHGIQLIHIWEDDWKYKRTAVENYLHSKLGNCLPIYARHTKVKVVPHKEAKQFLDKYHIQGKDNSKVYLGLYLEEELLSVMSFSKPRYSKQYQWELVRFCSTYQTNVIGGASKLLKHFESNYSPESIVSYADYSRSKGNLYNKLGFEFSHKSANGYTYFVKNSDKRHSRVQFQKHKLKSILEDYNEDLTELENMVNHGNYPIYDCGNLVFIKKY